MSELLSLLENNKIETVLVAIFILFIMKILDFVIKVLYSTIADKVSPVYKEAKVERIKKYLLQLLDLTMEQLISDHPAFIRAYVMRKCCEDVAIIAAANRPMYSEPRIFLDSVETLLETGEVSSTLRRYGTEHVIAKKVVLKNTYYFVLEATTEVPLSEQARGQILIIEFMLKLLDDFINLWGDNCDEFKKGSAGLMSGNVQTQPKVG